MNHNTSHLSALKDAMTATNAILQKAIRKNKGAPLLVRKSIEWKNAMEAYRAYWAAVDASREASQAGSEIQSIPGDNS